MAFLFLTSVIGCMTGCGKMKEAAGTRDAGKTAGADAGLNGVHVDFAKEVNEDWSAMFAR